MTILLTKDLRVGGVLLASGTTQTFGADLEADIVARQGATYLTDPTPGKTVPVVATTNLTGVIELSAGGVVIPSAGPAFTFASLPSAVGLAGYTVRVTDIGTTGAGVLFISDGTKWRPLNGKAVISAQRAGTLVAPVGSVASVALISLSAGPMVQSGLIKIPAGMLAAGFGLGLSARIRHTGSVGAWSMVARIGTSGTSADSSIGTVTGAATNDQSGWVLQEIQFASSTSFLTPYNLAPGGSSAAGSLGVRTTNVDTTADMYLGFYAASVTGPDTVDVVNYELSLLG